MANDQQNKPPVNMYPGLGMQKDMPNHKKKKILIGVGLIIALLVGGFVYYQVSIPNNSNVFKPIANGSSGGGEKNVENPLTGVKYTEAEAQAWIEKRPLAAMVNNFVDARPHSGLVDADIVYEIVAEGGITRFLAFFLSETPEKIGPIRSTRHYYLVVVKELGDAMLAHIGWSPQALEAIETWPVRSLARGGAQFWRDQARIDSGIAIEHTAYYNGKELRQLGDELGWDGKDPNFRPWLFKDDSPADATSSVVGENTPIEIDFWFEGDYSAIWNYDRATNSYLRFTGYDSGGNPIPHTDLETGEQVTVKNLIVQFVTESAITGDDSSRLDYQLIGSGSGIVFIDGKAIRVTWAKDSREGRTVFYDENGKEVEFNRGKFWISIVPERNQTQVTY